MSTLKDVARLAGVSVATASLAINGKPVHESTRRLVLACAKKLNYVPNRSGQTLITGISNTILMVILNSTRYTNLVVDTTFFYNYIEGVLEVASKQGYSLTFDVRNWEDEDLGEYFSQKVHGKSVDGMIIIPQFMRPYDFCAVLGDFPYVVLNAWDPDRDLVSLEMDNYLGGRLIARYMQRCGYQKIAFINGPDEHYDASERRRGFFDVLGSSHDIVETSGDWTTRSGYEAAEKVFSQQVVDAVFCGNDYMASGVLRYLLLNQYRIPEDVSIIGYDNIGLSRAIFPRLSTVDGYLQEIGSGLAQLLMQRMGVIAGDGEKPAKLKPKLIIRESSKPID